MTVTLCYLLESHLPLACSPGIIWGIAAEQICQHVIENDIPQRSGVTSKHSRAIMDTIDQGSLLLSFMNSQAVSPAYIANGNLWQKTQCLVKPFPLPFKTAASILGWTARTMLVPSTRDLPSRSSDPAGGFLICLCHAAASTGLFDLQP